MFAEVGARVTIIVGSSVSTVSIVGSSVCPWTNVGSIVSSEPFVGATVGSTVVGVGAKVKVDEGVGPNVSFVSVAVVGAIVIGRERVGAAVAFPLDVVGARVVAIGLVRCDGFAVLVLPLGEAVGTGVGPRVGEETLGVVAGASVALSDVSVGAMVVEFGAADGDTVLFGAPVCK